MNNARHPKVHGEYLAAQKDLACLNGILEQTKGRYKRELANAARIPFQTMLADWLIALISFGFIQPSNRQIEIESKRKRVHQTFCELIDKIEKDIAQISSDFQQVSKLEHQFTISIKLGVRADGYPSNWEDISRAVRERDGYHCTHSGCGVTGLILHVHHVIPLSQGGSNALSNLVTLCEKHHIAKHPHMRR